MRGDGAAKTPEERLVHWTIVSTWGAYVLGAVYVTGPVLAMTLVAMLAWRHYASPWRPCTPLPGPFPAGVAVWCACMAAMLLALLVVHLSEGMGAVATLKSSIGWLKGWALLALFPAAGAGLSIRPAVVVRATCILAAQTLALMPFLVMAGLLHLPSELYVSPLQAIGGPGPEFFTVTLYIVDPSNGQLRWQFMAPWAPAAGMIGNMFFFLATFDRDRRWQAAGLACGFLMALMTGSRMAVLFMVVYPPLVWGLSRLSDWRLLSVAAALSLAAGIAGDRLLDVVGEWVSRFRSARMDSTRVREALGRVAVQRWADEAPTWGHGVVGRGNHFVEYMPIGSHHTWYGLLYVKGIVGFAALAAALLWSFLELILLAQVSRVGRMGLTMTVMLLFYSFGENLEILAYLAWPGLLLVGCAFAEASRIASTASGAAAPGEAAT